MKVNLFEVDFYRKHERFLVTVGLPNEHAFT